MLFDKYFSIECATDTILQKKVMCNYYETLVYFLDSCMPDVRQGWVGLASVVGWDGL